MPLIATYAGWETNAETGKSEYVIRLVSDRREDIPDLVAEDIWNANPLQLSRVRLPESQS